MSQRRVDVERLLSDPTLLLGRHGGQGPHVVEPIGELDHEHSEITSHRHEHLAHGGACAPPSSRTGSARAWDPVDNGGHIRAELRLHIGEAQLGVLNCVVQQRRSERHLVKTDLSDDPRHGQRVVDIALSHSTWSACGEHSPPPHKRATPSAPGLWVMPSVHRQDRCQLTRCEVLVAPPRQGNTRSTVDRQYSTRLSARRSLSGTSRRERAARHEKPQSTTTAPSASTRRQVAAAVPPVASTSSMISIRSFG